ncbi:MAG: DUF4118 domain-containing protein [Sandaracinaceae bacterium]|nr:DUF4118 domain-containing protein [Sandaracinaceae bacterium]
MLFLLAVMAVGGLFGRGRRCLAAALGVACYDFFFVPPFTPSGSKPVGTC